MSRSTRAPISEADYTVEDRGFETPCWIWKHCLQSKGYGRVRNGRGEQDYAHRVIYEQRIGPIPPKHQIDHLCRVHDCVRVDHFDVVTHAENLRRGKGTKLTAAQVETIRSDIRLQKDIAAEHGIHPSHVSKIKAGRKWVAA